MREQTMLTVPNAISIGRLLAVPVLFMLALAGQPTAFLVVLSCSLFSDSVDGLIARKLNQVTVLGAQLDSWGDFANYISTPICGLWLWPEIMAAESPYVVTVLLSYLGAVAIGVVKFGRLPTHHSWGAKLSAVCIGPAAIVMFGFRFSVPFRICVVLSVLAAVEDVAITTALDEWRANVPSLWHALRIRNEQRRQKAVEGQTKGRVDIRAQERGSCEAVPPQGS